MNFRAAKKKVLGGSLLSSLVTLSVTNERDLCKNYSSKIIAIGSWY
jgi:hypothetical protein